MNNTDFRRFVLDTPRNTQNASPGSTAKPGPANSSLGSRSKSSIPMTPRTVKGAPSIDFARQLAEHNATSKPAKTFRSSAAPKGVKLGEGYTDRALHRASEEHGAEAAAQDEREARVSALEEQMKLGQIDRATFENLRDSITGGDIGATHLVKGLDRQLLERVRKGEDVLASKTHTEESAVEREPTPELDPEEELEKMEHKELAPVEHGRVEKKGEMAPPPKPVAGTKRSRNDILAELKASRRAAEQAKAASQPRLGSKFKRFGEQRSTEPRIERDERGREVLITVDENGRVKRKVRKVLEEDKATSGGILMPDKKAKPLGMVVPEPAATSTEQKVDDDEDIFEGVDVSYDPLAALGEGDSSSSSSDDEAPPHEDHPTGPSNSGAATTSQATGKPVSESPDSVNSHSPPPSAPPNKTQPTKHNYFNETTTAEEPAKGLDDPAILETLKRAAAMRSPVAADETPTDAPTAEPDSSAARRLLQRDRDLDDIDMGFGSSRFGDEEEEGEGGSRLRLSEWKGGIGGDDDDEGGDRNRGGQKQRKRGKKKKKGDKDSAADVLRVMEGRQR